MNLSFKDWIIAEAKKKQLPVHQNMKQWVKSVESLEKELETLKAIFKAKKLETPKKDDKPKDVTKKINVIDKKLDATKDKKPGEKHELPSGEKQVPKPAPFLRKGKENIKEPTKVDKDQNAKDKKVNGNDRPS